MCVNPTLVVTSQLQKGFGLQGAPPPPKKKKPLGSVPVPTEGLYMYVAPRTQLQLIFPPVQQECCILKKKKRRCVIGCPAERRECMHRFARNSSFCQAHAFEVLTPISPPGGTQLYCCTHARPQVFRTHPKQVLSIGQIYTLFKYFRVLF